LAIPFGAHDDRGVREPRRSDHMPGSAFAPVTLYDSLLQHRLVTASQPGRATGRGRAERATFAFSRNARRPASLPRSGTISPPKRL
jgi:hypothetical protein